MTAVGDKEGIDPIQLCITIVSACQLVFRRNILEVNCIGIIPPYRYKPKSKHSIKAMHRAKHMSEKLGVKIQHARNGEGRRVIRPYKVDS